MGDVTDIEKGKKKRKPKTTASPVVVWDAALDERIGFLGHKDFVYYYYNRQSGQVSALTPLAHKNLSLMSLAPRKFWADHFTGTDGISWDTAADALMQRATRAGVFDPDRIRGRGAWQEADGRVVINVGDKLFVDRKFVDHADLRSHYCYVSGVHIEANLQAQPLDVEEAQKVIATANAFNWAEPLSGRLLAGWVVVAQICGILPWRPHLWLTGASGSGKTTLVLNRFVKPLVAFRYPRDFVGGSTEAGIRQTTGLDRLAILFDESESQDAAGKERVMRLAQTIRAASSATERLAKGTTSGRAVYYELGGCFFLTSINIPLTRHADKRRLTPIEVAQGDPKDTATLDKQLKLITPEFGARLFARIVQMVPTLLGNIAVYQAALLAELGDFELAQQFAPLMAGCHLLEFDEAAPPGLALEKIKDQDWQPFQTKADESDQQQCLDSILAARITDVDFTVTNTTTKSSSESHHKETRTVGELIRVACALEEDPGLTPTAARRHLKRYGVWVREGEDEVWIANNNEALDELLKGQPWHGSGWAQYLKRLPDAHPTDRARFAEVFSRATAIPKKLVLDPGNVTVP